MLRCSPEVPADAEERRHACDGCLASLYPVRQEVYEALGTAEAGFPTYCAVSARQPRVDVWSHVTFRIDCHSESSGTQSTGLRAKGDLVSGFICCACCGLRNPGPGPCYSVNYVRSNTACSAGAESSTRGRNGESADATDFCANWRSLLKDRSKSPCTIAQDATHQFVEQERD